MRRSARSVLFLVCTTSSASTAASAATTTAATTISLWILRRRTIPSGSLMFDLGVGAGLVDEPGRADVHCHPWNPDALEMVGPRLVLGTFEVHEGRKVAKSELNGIVSRQDLVEAALGGSLGQDEVSLRCSVKEVLELRVSLPAAHRKVVEDPVA